MGNNNKMTENYVQKIWVKNVIHLGLISIFGRLSCRRYCTLGTCIF